MQAVREGSRSVTGHASERVIIFHPVQDRSPFRGVRIDEVIAGAVKAAADRRNDRLNHVGGLFAAGLTQNPEPGVVHPGDGSPPQDHDRDDLGRTASVHALSVFLRLRIAVLATVAVPETGIGKPRLLTRVARILTGKRSTGNTVDSVHDRTGIRPTVVREIPATLAGAGTC